TTMEKLILLVTAFLYSVIFFKISFFKCFFCYVFCISAKPGVCPGNNLEEAMLGVCAEMCSHDSDCPNDEKCCSNGCGHQCMPPYNEKPGVCPSKNLGEEGLCVEMCSHDSNCPNDQKCCSNGCGHQFCDNFGI
uniref:WAP domain-containing protein n=1 Tax=Sinocyclocheilus anshuiensis TaxID=1608454 RepID=A0A671M325_9TELE